MDVRLPDASKAAWANGCEHCQFGIVRSAPLTNAVGLFEERAAQMARREVEFCDCRAGHMQRQYIRKVYRNLSQEDYARICKAIDTAAAAILSKDAVDAPTIHYESQEV